MEIDDLAKKLEGHEARSQERHEYTVECLKKHHLSEMEAIEEIEAEEAEEVKAMTQPINVFEPGYGGGAGAAGLGGAGGAALGALFGSALGSGGGLFGGRNGNDGVVTPMQLQTATASIVDSSQNNQIMGMLQGISTSVPLTAAQTQLAVAGNTEAIRTHLGQVENTITAGQLANLNAINGVNVNVLTSAAATREAINAMGVANLTATANSTKEIIAALTAQDIASLNRQLTVAELRNAEDRAEARARGTEVTVTQTVNQNNLMQQQQSQSQQQAILLSNIWSRLDGMQQAIATNNSMIIGNSGPVASGPQTSAPINVKT